MGYWDVGTVCEPPDVARRAAPCVRRVSTRQLGDNARKIRVPRCCLESPITHSRASCRLHVPLDVNQPGTSLQLSKPFVVDLPLEVQPSQRWIPGRSPPPDGPASVHTSFEATPKVCHSFRVDPRCPPASVGSHPTLGVHQEFLSPLHWELNISPDTILGGKIRSCHPTGTCMR